MHFIMRLLRPLLLSVRCGCDAVLCEVFPFQVLGQEAKYQHCGRVYAATVPP